MGSVTLRHVVKDFGGVRAVHGIDLEVLDGEFMVFVGPSGCAKSTTLRMIAGLEEITSGEVLIGNSIVNDVLPKDRGIAMVFQNYALYPHKTAYDNMAFGLRMQGIGKEEIRMRVEDAARKLDILELLDRKPKEMSGGQRQRVAVGRAIVRQPEVFLFDEPLSNLDAKLRVSMRVKIAQLHKSLKEQGRPATMIYVTHDQTEALTLGDRICVLQAGSIMQVDTPERLYNYPANKFVAGFIGSPAMNFLRGILVRDSERYFVQLPSGDFVSAPESRGRDLSSYIGGEVDFGIRPEHVSIFQVNESSNQIDFPPHQGIEGVLEVVENMGNEKYLHFRVGSSFVVSRINARNTNTSDIGRSYKLVFETGMAHLFDSQKGVNVLL